MNDTYIDVYKYIFKVLQALNFRWQDINILKDRIDPTKLPAIKKSKVVSLNNRPRSTLQKLFFFCFCY
jgi:hypothetical protein